MGDNREEMRVKKIKMTVLVLCASMLAGTAGCSAADKPDMTSFSQTETETETSAEDTAAVTESTEPVVSDSGVDYLEGFEKFELTSTDLENGVWAEVITHDHGKNVSPELSWEPVEGAAEYVVYMIDMHSADQIVCGSLHWKSNGITVTELPQGWASSSDYAGPRPPAGETHIYEVYVVALKEPVERLKGAVRGVNPNFPTFIQELDIDSEGNPGNILAYGKISGTYTG